MKKYHYVWTFLALIFSWNLLAAPVVFSTSNLQFGSIDVGTSKTMSVTVKNSTRQQVRLSEYWFNNSDSYSVVGGTCQFNEFILKARKSCTLSIKFTPTYSGLISDSMTVGYFKGTGWTWVESNLNLSGTGLEVVVVEPTPTPTPTPAPDPAPRDPSSDVPASFLRVVGNKIVDANNVQVVFKGVNIADPQHLDTKANERPGVTARSVASLATDTYFAKVVRIPILPGNPNYPTEGWFSPTNGGESYFLKHVQPLVDELTSKGIYVIIDLHYVSNYDTLYSKAAEFWTYMAPKFKDNPYVMYEIFNEPILPDSWSTWKQTMAQPIVNLIRQAAPYNLVLVGGPYWSSHMSGAVTDPVIGENLVYVAHIYSNQGPTSWSKNYGVLPDYSPMFVTEWGYETGGTEGGNFAWGDSLVTWMDQKKMSWTAWCFDPLWGPRMVDNNWNLLIGDGHMGGHVRDLLIENNRQTLP